MNRKVLVIHVDNALDEALEELTTSQVSWAPVGEVKALTQDCHIVGVISIACIVQFYRSTIVKDSQRMQGLIEGAIIKREV